MVAGWLSQEMTAAVELDLPPGEALLYLPIAGEAVGGVWPIVHMNLAGVSLDIEAAALAGPGWQTVYALVSTPGGRVRLQATLSNGTVAQENGRFVERRSALGPVKVLTPQAIPGVVSGETRRFYK